MDYFLIYMWLFGFYSTIILNFLGIYNGRQGVDYYGEAHLSQWNSLIHTAFMPFTSYGILLFFPNLIGLNKLSATLLIDYVYLFYFGHYFYISPYIGLLFAFFFYFFKKLVKHHYSYSISKFVYGLLVAFISLSIQEYVGHYMGGDIPSRVEGILNAILYANYFALESFTNYTLKSY